MIVYTTGNGVNGFPFDPGIGSFYGVFDGHGGKECADFCAKETLSSLLKALNSLEAELKKEEKQKVVEQNEVSRLYKISPFLSLSPI